MVVRSSPHIVVVVVCDVVVYLVKQVKLLCFSDKCLVLSPDQLPTRNFVMGLKHHLCRSKI